MLTRRQNAADRMAGAEDDAVKWAVVVAVPKEVRQLSAAEEGECSGGGRGGGPVRVGQARAPL